MHHPREWNEPGDLRPGQHSDGPHHRLCPHHPCLVPQNTCALGLLRLDLKHQVGKMKRDFKRKSVTSVSQTELYFEHLQGGGEAVSGSD